ncbi:hypothetical protein AVEN_36705-1 [Araneus ventricosus]|uniref:Uncharacterized protein n=1 Tax=Araneus ventricosus TaxID=182803 RepID=A0A4Y2AU91_ARAVE|nr:hypothetical protein AVEN_36705-1 [Araneus ventricosus]
MWARCTLNYTRRAKRPPAGVVRKPAEGMPSQVYPSSSADGGSKLRAILLKVCLVALASISSEKEIRDSLGKRGLTEDSDYIRSFNTLKPCQ